MSCEQSCAAAATKQLFFAPGVPSPSLQSTKEHIDAHIEYIARHRHALELQLQEVQVTERWLGALRGHIVARDLNAQIGADLAVAPPPPLREPKQEKKVEKTARPGSSGDRTRSRSRVREADCDVQREARPCDGGGEPGQSEIPQAGGGRGGKRHVVPPFLCRVCWNEARGLRPAGAHAKGTGDVECRLAPDQPVAKGTEAIKSAAKKAVDRAGSRAAGAGPAQAPAQLAKSGEEADALDVQEQAASPTAAEDPAHAPAAKELPKGGGKADALGAQLPAAEQSAAAEGHEPAQQEPGAAPPAGEEGNPSSASPLGSSDRRKFDDLFSSPEGRGDADI